MEPEGEDPISAEAKLLDERIRRLQRLAINPLHVFVLPAQLSAPWFERRALGPEEVAASDGWGPALSQADGSYRADPCRSIELGGVLGLYELLASDFRCHEILFVNDLSRIVHGIDAVTWDPASDRYYLFESKGTTRSIHTRARAYLRNTKTKGRQLSWEWCWKSWMELSQYPQSAAVFLRLLRPILERRVERVLVVSHVVRVQGGFVCDGQHNVWEDADLDGDQRDFATQRRWFDEIQAAGVWYAPHAHPIGHSTPLQGDLRNRNLIGLDFPGETIARIDLRGALLHGVSLEGATLEDVRLDGACLFGADLGGADLRLVSGLGPDQVARTFRDERTRWPIGLVPHPCPVPTRDMLELLGQLGSTFPRES